MSDTSTIITELDRWFRSDQGISSRKKELLRNTIMAIEQLQALARVDRSDWRHIDIGDTGFFCDPRIVAEIERLRAENDKLRMGDVVIRRTRDGVPVYPDSLVFLLFPLLPRPSKVARRFAREVPDRLWSRVYSTELAALAAGGGDGK